MTGKRTNSRGFNLPFAGHFFGCVLFWFVLFVYISCDVKKSLNQASKEYFTNFNLCLILFGNRAIFL